MSAINQPFADKLLAELVRVESTGSTLHVLTREGVSKEFKETFRWGSIGLYARTMAAFANAKGGYIVFGVTDNPRTVVGLDETSAEAFDNLDQAKLTDGLNVLFSPVINWEIEVFEVAGLKLGAIYTFESDDKPVVAKRSSQEQNAKLVEGDILYRYNSRTERAKFPELRRILDDAKIKEQRSMMKHVEELIKAGASNAAVLDFRRSTIQGPSGQKVLVDEGLLKSIAFIKEGEFEEVSGAPTLKVVGEVVPARTIAVGPERIVRSTLTTEDVLKDFFDQSHIGNPEEYIRQAATGSTSFLPVQFYRAAAEMSHDRLIQLVKDETTRSQSKKKLMTRLTNNDPMSVPVPSTSAQHAATVRRRKYYEELIAGKIDKSALDSKEEATHLLNAVKSLRDEEVQGIFEQIREFMSEAFRLYYGDDSKLADAVRRAACRVDMAMYAPEVQ